MLSAIYLTMLLMGAAWVLDLVITKVIDVVTGRPQVRSTTCRGCGATTSRVNACDNSLSAFCADDCYHAFMLEYYPNG